MRPSTLEKLSPRPWIALLLLLVARMAGAVDLVPTGAEWRYFAGVSEASSPDPTAWRKPGFNDAAWATGPATFWYGDVFTGTQIQNMQGNYSSLFLRRTFNVANPADVQSLLLKAQCDDGFILWINGVEVQRYNVPDGELAYNALASTAATPDPAVFNEYPIANGRALLQSGVNQLAAQVFNVNLGSSDLVWDASLVATLDDGPPQVASTQPPAGGTVQTLYSWEVEFSESVTGIDASDLLVNGIAATNVSAVSPSQYLFTFPSPPAGAVTLTFRAGHGITDLAGSPHPFGGYTATYRLDPQLRLPGLEITEFLANNDRGLRDEDGDRGDWIELHNSAATAQSLAGWSLTDDPASPRKWTFPVMTLGADRYLVVFASGKDRSLAGGRLHTNFKLSNDGGFLALVSPAGEVVSGFGDAYPPQRKDVSFGRAAGAPNLTGYFVKPTPGAANGTSGTGFAPGVRFSAGSRTFTTTATVELSLDPPSPDAVIRVTQDGSLPTENSPAYAGPITLSATAQVRARAFAPGLLPGAPRSETFVKLASSAASARTDLPVLLIHNFGQGRPPATTTHNAHFQLFEPVNGVTSLANPPTLARRVGIGSRGSSTLGQDKVNISLEFRDEFDADQNESLLGLPADSDWVLYAPNNFEPVLVHNPFMHQLSRDIGRYSSRTRFVELYLATSGVNAQVSSANYYGIYVLEEKIKRGPDRVDVDALTPGETRQPYITGGFILKIDRAGPGESGLSAANTQMIYVDPKEREITLPDYAAHRQYLQNYMNAFGTALYGTSWRDPVKGYAAYVDVPSWIDHHLLNVVALNVDSLRLSTYFYKPRSGKLQYGPLWDFDRALGSTDGRDQNPRLWSGVVGAGTDFFNETTQAWWGRLFQDPDFYQQYIDRYQELRRTHFATTNLHRLVDELTGVVRKAQPREYSRWGGTLRTSTGVPGGSYSTEVLWMKRWLSNRVEFIDGQFVRPANLVTPAGRFTNSVDVLVEAPAVGTVYYTLDGSDPRLPGGGVSPVAQVAAGGRIPVAANARVVVRVQNPAHTALTGAGNPPLVSRWSGPVSATYYQSLPPLRVTEIHYHPTGPAAGSTNAASDFEFIELRNASAQPLSLVGFRLEGAVQFRFESTNAVTSLSPGLRLLVAANPAALALRYPGLGVAVLGPYSGRLSNGGETLRLRGPLGEPIQDLRYQPEWGPLADGFGFSLVPKDEAAPVEASGDATAWRLSARVGGSPGQADPKPADLAPVVVNEALTHTDPPLLDTIELFNAGDRPQDVGGWWVTDDYRTPEKFRMPVGTILPAGGHLLLDETQFRTGTGGNVGFSLSALGDSVHLFSAEASGQLTGWHSGFDFDAAFNGVSIGREVTSDGREWFVAQSARTLGGPNSGPRVGPAVLTEVHYQPASNGPTNNTADEFVELRNVAPVPLALFDPAHPTNTWHLRGAVRLDFPPGLTLPAGGFALVVGFDPVANPAQLAAFVGQFAPPEGTPILGPWEGALDNAGEMLRLLAPDEPVPAGDANAGEVGYVLIDAVRYRAEAPWPTGASGTGLSLQRVPSRGFGHEPRNWRTGTPTAGRVNDPSDTLAPDADGDGLPDAWEVLQGLDPRSAAGDDGANGDPDHDGFTNAQELAAGTSPRDPASRLVLTATRGASPGEGLRLRFPATVDRSYTILGSTRLDGGAWEVLVRFPRQTSDTTLDYMEPPGLPYRFFRVSTP